jgi:two-component system sensor histidine kinase VanS
MSKKNFSVKIFIGITCILLAVGLLVFWILRVFLPKIYMNELESRVQINTVDFVKELETVSRIEWWDKIEQFCYLNNINATVYTVNGGYNSTIGVQFSSLNDYKMKHSKFDMASAIKFYYATRAGIPCIIVFYYNPKSIEYVTDTFDTMFPVLFAVIFIVSIIIAFIYTRFMVKSRNLQIANEKLKDDIEKERRRRSFFSAVSHELKTPVTILKGELDGMILGVGKFKDRDKYLQEAYETTESIEKLVREIMTAAKLDIVKLTPEEINLSEVTDECLMKIGELISEKNITIKQEFSAAKIFADKKLMGIVISNIIGNAVKHSPQGTAINIGFNETAEFSVENYGVHIVDTSAETDISGGLGLYIVKSILDLHGFKYSFENTADGTLFLIKFSKM